MLAITMTFEEVRILLQALRVRERLIAKLALLAVSGRVKFSNGNGWRRTTPTSGRGYPWTISTHQSLIDPCARLRFRTRFSHPSMSGGHLSLDTNCDKWVFASEKLNTPLAKDDCWRRHFLPKLKVDLDWAGRTPGSCGGRTVLS